MIMVRLQLAGRRARFSLRGLLTAPFPPFHGTKVERHTCRGSTSADRSSTAPGRLCRPSTIRVGTLRTGKTLDELID